ncbi:DUF1049 domain-containing protein [Vagococcus entomophilus]|nr:DUF1049 domain-containing protein [Vagococcus entomophilus]
MDKFKKVVTPKRVLALIILVLVLVFGFQNLNPVELTLIFFSVKVPLLVLILVLYVLGIISGWVYKKNDIKKIVSDVQKETKAELADLKKQVKSE